MADFDLKLALSVLFIVTMRLINIQVYLIFIQVDCCYWCCIIYPKLYVQVIRKIIYVLNCVRVHTLISLPRNHFARGSPLLLILSASKRILCYSVLGYFFFLLYSLQVRIVFFFIFIYQFGQRVRTHARAHAFTYFHFHVLEKRRQRPRICFSII